MIYNDSFKRIKILYAYFFEWFDFGGYFVFVFIEFVVFFVGVFDLFL